MLAAGKASSIPLLPAVASASEIMLGLEYGYTCFKLFPAAVVGGVAVLKAFAGPFSAIRFCPTGGIDRNNGGDYLALDNVTCVGGSWVAPESMIAAQDWTAIEQLAEETRMLMATP
jgi:2-dehydro-3-deoxyphosphogluconate aldolase/(4S)-4-hydroxy-2-oxoglutarate aldolase